MLDEKDKIILEALFQDATISTKELAKLARITQPGTFYRVKQLENKGYVWRYDAILNWNLIPLIKKKYFCDLSPELLKALIPNVHVLALFEIVGQYKHVVWCFFRNKVQQQLFERQLPKKKLSITIKEVYSKPLSLFDISLPFIHTQHEQAYSLTPEDIAIFNSISQGGAKKSVLTIAQETGFSIDVV
ncbi:MAG: Lrp/AsnC family transcriptional regulator, partial [Candidatus Woesearchaeota archaeon]